MCLLIFLVCDACKNDCAEQIWVRLSNHHTAPYLHSAKARYCKTVKWSSWEETATTRACKKRNHKPRSQLWRSQETVTWTQKEYVRIYWCIQLIYWRSRKGRKKNLWWPSCFDVSWIGKHFNHFSPILDDLLGNKLPTLLIGNKIILTFI